MHLCCPRAACNWLRVSFYFLIGIVLGTLFNHISVTLRIGQVNSFGGRSLCDTAVSRLSTTALPEQRPKAVLNVLPNWSKIKRPRYLASELSIRRKLFVGVLSTDASFASNAAVFNQSLQNDPPDRLIFFVNTTNASAQRHTAAGVTVVTYTDNNPSLLPLHVLTYINEHLSNQFDWYMLVPDNVFIVGSNLLEALSYTSVSHNWSFGASSKEQHVCDLSAGVLLSRKVVSAILAGLPACAAAWSARDAQMRAAFEQCLAVTHASLPPCQSTAAAATLHWVRLGAFGVVDFVQRFAPAPDSRLSPSQLDSVVAVYPMQSERDFADLRQLFLEHSIQKLQLSMADYQRDMEAAAKQLGTLLSWPAGVAPKAKPRTRFDVNRWDYFNATHVFFPNDEENVRALWDYEKADVEWALVEAVRHLSAEEQVELRLRRLASGYRQFESGRGMEYIVDIEVDAVNATDAAQRPRFFATAHRLQLLKTLGEPQLVPMPFVTETTPLTLVLPVHRDNVAAALRTFNSFVDNFLQTDPLPTDTALFVMLLSDVGDVDEILDDNQLHGDDVERNSSAVDDFGPLLHAVDKLLTQKPLVGEKRLVLCKLMPKTSLALSELASAAVVELQHLRSQDPILFLLSADSIFTRETLNRVRLSTIRQVQTYFPVAFTLYNPEVVFSGATSSERRRFERAPEVHKSHGRFSLLSARWFAGFYMSDFQAAQDALRRSGQPWVELMQLFVNYSDLMVFRGVEPKLLVRYRERCVRERLDADLYSLCAQRFADVQGSRQQLAQLLLPTLVRRFPGEF